MDGGWEPSRDWSRTLDIVDERWISGVESCRCWDGVVLDVVVCWVGVVGGEKVVGLRLLVKYCVRVR